VHPELRRVRRKKDVDLHRLLGRERARVSLLDVWIRRHPVTVTPGDGAMLASTRYLSVFADLGRGSSRPSS
jgi:hypothetical protein